MTASKTCGLVDECKYNNGECSQVCVDTYDSYYCTCRQGYRLARNEYTCPGKLSRFPWAVICTLLTLLVYYFLFLRSTHRNILFVAASSDYYFARGSGCEIVWWITYVCLYVCLSVREDISGTTRTIFANFCACCLCPRLGPLLVCWQ